MQVKACCGGVSMFTNMTLFILFKMFLNPSFKMTTSFANVAATIASTRFNTEKDFVTIFIAIYYYYSFIHMMILNQTEKEASIWR